MVFKLFFEHQLLRFRQKKMLFAEWPRDILTSILPELIHQIHANLVLFK